MASNTPSNKITDIKNFIQFCLDFKNVEYDITFFNDELSNGYVYFITTEYATGLFSDTTHDGSVNMFIFNNQLYNLAKAENLSDDDIHSVKLYIPILYVYDFVSYLSTKKLKSINI